MLYTDTRDKNAAVSLEEAVMSGMNEKTGGLYVPVQIPVLSEEFRTASAEPSFRNIAYEMASLYTDGDVERSALEKIIQEAYPFMPKLTQLNPDTFCLELFHGPTCAFKDFGARFMARLMEYFNKKNYKPLNILVATSGDTGSAVGSAFSGLEGLTVSILYPKGKISPLQEKQLSTFTGNVRSFRVDGTFDDCQALVKKAFTDVELRSKLRLSSANSINISRLLPQSFYYMYSSLVAKSRFGKNAPIIMSVPSGNFGNLMSGFIARKMGAPIRGFVIATNANRTVPDWISTGKYTPRKSVPTLANAMDVGNPSNFERMSDMYSLEEVRDFAASYWISDEGILRAIRECYERTGYIIDPHGACAYKAWSDLIGGGMKKLLKGEKRRAEEEGLSGNIPEWGKEAAEKKCVGIVLETAHPAKFESVVKEALSTAAPMPERLLEVMTKKEHVTDIPNDYSAFKELLFSTLS